MGKGYNNYMTKKPFHPGSKANIKRTWMAEQRAENEKKKQEDLKTQYEKEQDLYNNRALLSTESKDKLELNFMYEAPPGAKRERQKEDDEPEYKFEWQRKYNAPREDYAKGNAEIRDQPFGIPVRNVRCIKCHKWGHINTDKECPLYSHASTSSMPTTSMDPLELMRQMREDGYNLKQNVLGHCVNPKSANQQFIPSDESDPEMDFLKSLTSKQKRKLLKKLNKLSKKQKKKDEEAKKKKKRDKLKKKSGASASESEEKPKQKKKKSKAKEESSNTDSESESSDEDSSRLVSEKHRKAPDRKQAKQNVTDEKPDKHKKNLPDDSSLSSDSDDDSSKKKAFEKKKKSCTQSSSHSAEHNRRKRKAKHDDSSHSNSEQEDESPPPKKAKNSKDKDKEKSHTDSKQEKKKHKGDSEASSKNDTTKQSAAKKSTEVHTEEEMSISAELSKRKLKERKEKISESHHTTSVKSPNLDGKKVIDEDQSLTKKDRSAKQDEHKDKTRTKTHSSSEDSSSEKCQQQSESSVKVGKSSKSKDSNKKNTGGEEQMSLPCSSKSEAVSVKSGEKVHEDSPVHPDGFDHEFPQRYTGEENTSLTTKYGVNHDRFRDLHRHRRSPSVKHKYRN